MTPPHILRTIRGAPLHWTAFILTLALGVGANGALFSAVYAVLLRPLPHRNGSELVVVTHPARLSGIADATFSVPEIQDLREQARTIRGAAEYSKLSLILRGDGEPRSVAAGIVSANFFEVLGLDPVTGRLIDSRDDGRVEPVVVLSHPYWTSHFGRDSAVVGRLLDLNGRTMRVIGVLQPAPHFDGRGEIFVNLAASPHHLSASMQTDRKHRMTGVLARLAPGATVADAAAELTVVHERMRSAFAEAYPASAGYEIQVESLREELSRGARGLLLALSAGALFVLLVANANLAALTLTRSLNRRQEVHTRLALGATPGRITRELVAETLVMGALGSALGLVFAAILSGVLSSFLATYTPRAAEIAIDGTVIGAAILMGLGTALLAALASAVVLLRGGLDHRGTGGFRGRHSRALSLLSQAQVAFAMVGLALALWFAGSYGRLRNVPRGFEPAGVATLAVSLGAATPADWSARYDDALRRLETLPGVVGAAVAIAPPLTGRPWEVGVRVEGAPPPDAGDPPALADYRSVSSRYFDVLQIPLVEGRFLRDGESGDEVVVNEAFVRRFLRWRRPVGARIQWPGLDSAWRTVVGVAGDTRDHGLADEALPAGYHPAARDGWAQGFVVRAGGRGDETLRPARAILRAVAPTAPIGRAATLEELVRRDTASERVSAMLFSLFAVLAILIATVGVYGVVGFGVAQRKSEFGLRLALGAAPGDVVRGLLRERLPSLTMALAAGALAAMALSRVVRGLLFGAEPIHPATIAVAAGGALLCALLAAVRPAVLAGRIDPARTLRGE